MSMVTLARTLLRSLRLACRVGQTLQPLRQVMRRSFNLMAPGNNTLVPKLQGVKLSTTADVINKNDAPESKAAVVTEEKMLATVLEEPDYFKVKELVTLRELFDARVHFGHKKGTRHPHMTPYLFGNRLGVDIIDLEQTLELLHEALNFTAHVAFRKGIILFLTRHLQTLPVIEETASLCGEFSHCREWAPGTFTNSTKMFGEITRLPDLCIFISTHDNVFEQHEAVVESAKMNIPTVGILDSSCDPRLITYPVPGNDDSPSAINLYCNVFKEAILRGKAEREKFYVKLNES